MRLLRIAGAGPRVRRVPDDRVLAFRTCARGMGDRRYRRRRYSDGVTEPKRKDQGQEQSHRQAHFFLLERHFASGWIRWLHPRNFLFGSAELSALVTP